MRPELEALAKRQRGVFRRQQAVHNGYTAIEVKRLIRTGVWTKLRHGIYTAQPYDAALVTTDVRTHLLAGYARQLAMGGDTVLSHESAARFHGMDLLDLAPREPRLTRHRPAGRDRMTAHDLYVASVPEEHRVRGVPVTSAARTVVDCARCLSREAGFVTAESAFRLGIERMDVLAVLEACGGWPGTAEALELVLMAGPWSESALESRARLWFKRQRLPQPVQQRWITRLDGRFVGRVDFLWEEYRTVCETDGRIKYGEPAAFGKQEQDALWREKLREDTIRDLGLEVVRGYWLDGADEGEALAERLRRAFARGLRATGEPAYRIIGPDSWPDGPLPVGT